MYGASRALPCCRAETQHNDPADSFGEGRLLGFVRVVVGGQVFDLAVQSMSFEKDSNGTAGGFFSKDGQLGILVDDSVSPSEAKAQIERGTAEAVRHLSRRVLN
jgi:hypothetical protein